MDAKTEAQRILTESGQVAVASLTTDGSAPDVRIVLYTYLKEANTLLFMTAGNANKVAEFAAHDAAAFTTLPIGETNDVVRVRAAKINGITPDEAQLAQYMAAFPQTAKYAAHGTFFALTFSEADVTVKNQESTVEF
ncbi:pyridoxamine 5'-phosphate oxidase family protein [Lacticaseibacillus yichunensis]|uniref:Pyridoxamine 5'-phosphate oxidase family protein n=1 Tax=Lacticaseibacillus yichunensis TaxID=2486015 RepID=A0ABW4CTG3_9LACO|nr:pyridoxamine 5'-phosphate oxidase family protein [Lacticaseibacillus yichunensis]